jgi:hypothetical protein
MDINLRCSGCDEIAPTSYERLYSIWKSGYNKMSEDDKTKASLTAEIKCTCGHVERFSSPMFRYTFGTIFHEMLSLED